MARYPATKLSRKSSTTRRFMKVEAGVVDPGGAAEGQILRRGQHPPGAPELFGLLRWGPPHRCRGMYFSAISMSSSVVAAWENMESENRSIWPGAGPTGPSRGTPPGAPAPFQLGPVVLVPVHGRLLELLDLGPFSRGEAVRGGAPPSPSSRAASMSTGGRSPRLGLHPGRGVSGWSPTRASDSSGSSGTWVPGKATSLPRPRLGVPDPRHVGLVFVVVPDHRGDGDLRRLRHPPGGGGDQNRALLSIIQVRPPPGGAPGGRPRREGWAVPALP